VIITQSRSLSDLRCRALFSDLQSKFLSIYHRKIQVEFLFLVGEARCDQNKLKSSLFGMINKARQVTPWIFNKSFFDTFICYAISIFQNTFEQTATHLEIFTFEFHCIDCFSHLFFFYSELSIIFSFSTVLLLIFPSSLALNTTDLHDC
jgi:hypothetical protein